MENNFNKKELNKKIYLLPQIFSLLFGAISLALIVIGILISIRVICANLLEETSLFVGIILSVIGFIGICANYYCYRKIIRKNKEKYNVQ